MKGGKNMKKILSVMLTAILVVSTMGITALADTSAIYADRVFSLDFSSLSTGDYAKTGDVKNGVTSSSDGVNVHAVSGSGVTGPKVLTDYMATGDKINYLSFADKAISTSPQKYGNVGISEAKIKELLANTDQTFSVEFWAKTYKNKDDGNGNLTSISGRPFAYGISGNDALNKVSMEIYRYSYSGGILNYFRPIGKQYAYYDNGVQVTKEPSMSRGAPTVGEWNHYVLTKQWTPDAITGVEGKVTGDYLAYVYVNGSQTGSVDTSSNNNVIKTDDTGHYFGIGGVAASDSASAAATASNVFDGGIVEFNIYDRVLTSAEAATLYSEGAAKYKAAMLQVEDSFSVSSLTNGKETSVHASPGIIPVEFNNYVDASTIEGNITLTDSSGNPVDGFSASLADTTSKTVNIRHNALTQGATYTLNIGTGLKSINGIALSAPISATYVADLGHEKVFSLDLSAISAGSFATTGAVKNGVSGLSTGITSVPATSAAEGATGPKVLSDYSKNGQEIKYLSFSSPEKTTAKIPYGLINIDAATMNSLLPSAIYDENTYGEKTATFEFWVKNHINIGSDGNYSAIESGRVFRYGNSTYFDTGNNALSEIYMLNANSWFSRAIGRNVLYGASGASSSDINSPLAAANDGWSQYVFVRKWVPEAKVDPAVTANTGDYYYALYRDGQKMVESNTTSYTDVHEKNPKDCFLDIGGERSQPMNGGIAEFNIYDYDLSAAEVTALFEAKQGVYKNIVSFGDTLEVLNPASESISPLAGDIPLKFNNIVEASDLEGKITLEDENGNPVPGGVVLRSENALDDTVFVKHGRLQNGATYKLKVKKGALSKNGKALAEDFEETITTTDAFLFDFDFSGDNPRTLESSEYANYGINTVAEGASASLVSVSNNDETGSKTVLQLGNPQEDDGLGNLVYTTPKGDVIWRMPFVNEDKTANTGTVLPDDTHFAFEVSYKAVGGATQRTMYVYKGSYGNVPFGMTKPGVGYLLKPEFVGTSSNKDWPWVYKETGSFDSGTADSYGLINVKQTYIMEEYDPADTTEGKTLDGTNKSFTILTTNESDSQNKVLKSETRNLNNLFGVRLHQYVGTAPGGYVQIGKVKAYAVSPLELLKEPEYNRTNKTLVLTLTDDIIEETLVNLSVVDSYGNPIGAAPVWDAQNRTLTIIFSDVPDKNDVVNVSMVGVDSVSSGISNCAFKVTDSDSVVLNSRIVFTDQNDTEIGDLADSTTSVTASFTLCNFGETAITPRNMLVLYCGNYMKKIKIAEAAEIAASKEKKYTATIDLTDVTDVSISECRLKLISVTDFATLKPILISNNATI